MKVVVLAVGNSMRAIVDRDRSIVRGFYDHARDKRYLPLEAMLDDAIMKQGTTTLTLVVTNQALPRRGCGGWQGKYTRPTFMARAIQPFHTMDDGDALFMATTHEVEGRDSDRGPIGLLASELAWDAVLCSFGPGDSD